MFYSSADIVPEEGPWYVNMSNWTTICCHEQSEDWVHPTCRAINLNSSSFRTKERGTISWKRFLWRHKDRYIYHLFLLYLCYLLYRMVTAVFAAWAAATSMERALEHYCPSPMLCNKYENVIHKLRTTSRELLWLSNHHWGFFGFLVKQPSVDDANSSTGKTHCLSAPLVGGFWIPWSGAGIKQACGHKEITTPGNFQSAYKLILNRAIFSEPWPTQPTRPIFRQTK